MPLPSKKMGLRLAVCTAGLVGTGCSVPDLSAFLAPATPPNQLVQTTPLGASPQDAGVVGAVGSLTGTVLLPDPRLIGRSGEAFLLADGAGFIGNAGAGLIGNAGSGLIGNAGSGLVSNNSSGYRVLDIGVPDRLHLQRVMAKLGQTPRQGARVVLREPNSGDQVGTSVLTGDSGGFDLVGVPTGRYFVEAQFEEGMEIYFYRNLVDIKEGEQPPSVVCTITTLTTTRLGALARSGKLDLRQVDMEKLRHFIDVGALHITAARTPYMARDSADLVAGADQLVLESPDVLEAARDLAPAAAEPAAGWMIRKAGGNQPPAGQDPPKGQIATRRSYGLGLNGEPLFTTPQADGTTTVYSAGNDKTKSLGSLPAGLSGSVGLKVGEDGLVYAVGFDPLAKALRLFRSAASERFDVVGASLSWTATSSPEPGQIALDPKGNAYVALEGGHAIALFEGTGTSSHLIAGEPGVPGHRDGLATGARFNGPRGLALSTDGAIWVADSQNRVIRRIKEGNVETVAGKTGEKGSRNGRYAFARFESPMALAIAPDRAVWIADAGKVHRLTPDGSVFLVAGGGESLASVGPGRRLTLGMPVDILASGTTMTVLDLSTQGPGTLGTVTIHPDQ